MPGIDQQQLEPGVLEQIVERLPIIPGRLHHRARDLFRDQVIAQRKIRFVVDPKVVTVPTARLRPAPATRTQTLASRFEMSIPAHPA
jgi:hypothetical protein